MSVEAPEKPQAWFTTKIQELEAENARLKAENEYALQPFSEGNVSSFYDSMPLDGTARVFHAQLSFRQMHGWSDSALRDWAKSMTEYAFLDNRLGTTQRVQARPASHPMGYQAEIPAMPCAALGPFNKEGHLEVIVKFVIPE